MQCQNLQTSIDESKRALISKEALCEEQQIALEKHKNFEISFEHQIAMLTNQIRTLQTQNQSLEEKLEETDSLQIQLEEANERISLLEKDLISTKEELELARTSASSSS